MTWDLRIEVMFEVIGQLKEQSGNDEASQRVRLRERRIAVVTVRQMNGEQRVNPTADNRQHKVQTERWKNWPEQCCTDARDKKPKGFE